MRTPSAVGVRANGPIDPAWLAAQGPGWQIERMRNFTAAVTGEQPDLVVFYDGFNDTIATLVERLSERSSQVEAFFCCLGCAAGAAIQV